MNRVAWIVLLGLLFVFVLSLPALAAAPPSQPAGLAVTHRSGQSFITWQEVGALSGEFYRVYRHDEPITALNLNAATLLYELPEGSAEFFSNRYKVTATDWMTRYADRLTIEDGTAPLAAGSGLLVWTLDASDGLISEAHYAVTTVAGAEENVADFDSENSVGPVAEQPGEPLPVALATAPGANWHVYVQYMDLRRWNATFHAPHSRNQYYGLDPADPLVANAIQYAYDYAVYEPDADDCGGSVPDSLPLRLSLHAWQGNYYSPPPANPSGKWCAYEIVPVDTSESWWFGFARDYDFRLGGNPRAGDVVVNYTEQRVLRMVYDLMRAPSGPAVDAERVYVVGHSMGGSGALALALRYPNLFAAAHASKPMTDYAASNNWRGNAAQKWGNVGDNLPIASDGPSDWADHLQLYDGTGVWDWQDHQSNLQSRMADDIAPLGVVHSLDDNSIGWAAQGAPFYVALDGSRQSWGALISNDGHADGSFLGLPPALGSDGAGVPFAGLQVVRSETTPGLSNSSSNLPLPPTISGTLNHAILWSSSWDAWDGAPIDTADLWQISLCAVDPAVGSCGTGMTLTVDLTPRRLQTFEAIDGHSYVWQNQRISDGEVISSGVVTAATRGGGKVLLTVPDLRVTPGGNRITIVPAAPTAVAGARLLTRTAVGLYVLLPPLFAVTLLVLRWRRRSSPQ